MVYDERVVRIHNVGESPVLLINEAPGPQEATHGIPLFGMQGSILYRMIIKAEFNWALQWSVSNEGFSWPIKSQDEYRNLNNRTRKNLIKKSCFLALRAKNIACSNAFPQWHKSSKNAMDFTGPAESDILKDENMNRLISEVRSTKPKVLLVCGYYSYLACVGEMVINPKALEGTQITGITKEKINNRLKHNFSTIWYLGHTRRWSFNEVLILDCFKSIQEELCW